MPTFEIEVNGDKFEVDAPDMQTAAKSAQSYRVQQHPWIRANKAARAGQMPVEGQNYPDNGPGSSYMPTKTENAKQLAMLSAMIAAGPLAEAAVPAYPVLAPAVARTGVAAAPDLLTGDYAEGGKKALATAGVETLMSLLGVPGRMWSAYKAKGVAQPALHQAANFEPAPKLLDAYGKELSLSPKPITFQRPTGGSVTVEPPSGGRPITGGSSPAAILQEPITKTGGGLEVGQGARTVADVYAGENPDPTLGALAAVFDKVKGLNPFRHESPYAPGRSY